MKRFVVNDTLSCLPPVVVFVLWLLAHIPFNGYHLYFFYPNSHFASPGKNRDTQQTPLMISFKFSRH